MTETRLLHDAALDRTELDYRKRGYDFVRQPRPGDLPEGLRTVQPDAIATKSNDQVAIEVTLSGRPEAKSKADRLRSIIEQVSGWRFDHVIAQAWPEVRVQTIPPSEIGETLKAALRLKLQEPRAGLLLAWAALEAAARHSLPISKESPLRPTELIAFLTGEDLVDPDDEADLRKAAQIRNELAHGNLAVRDLDIPLVVVIKAANELLLEKVAA